MIRSRTFMFCLLDSITLVLAGELWCIQIMQSTFYRYRVQTDGMLIGLSPSFSEKFWEFWFQFDNGSRMMLEPEVYQIEDQDHSSSEVSRITLTISKSISFAKLFNTLLYRVS